MIKLKYSFHTLQPLFTGSDENFGTERKLRREKVLLKKPLKIESNFASDVLRREAILKILFNVWRNIDWEGIKGQRLMTIWDEFSSKLIASTGCRTKYQFLNLLCEKWGIRSLNDDYITEVLDLFHDAELLELVRNEHQYIVLKLRKIVKEAKEKREESGLNQTLSLFDFKGNKEQKKDATISFEKHFDTVPFVSGNSIRGNLRRKVMYDFCKRVGITKLDKDKYHQLFTGGNISDSTAYEDIARREAYIAMCPMMGLLGSAIGNMTIEGELRVGGARLKCLEHGSGERSYWELLDSTFGTRLDSSKTETEIKIEKQGDKKEVNQMKYEYEVFCVGAEFEHLFVMTSDSELLTSAFWHMMHLFKEDPFICGNSARDAGQIDLSEIVIPENATQKYLDYLEKYKDRINLYFCPIQGEKPKQEDYEIPDEILNEVF